MRAAILTLLAAAALAAQPFYPDDPLLAEPDPLRVEDAEFRKLNDYYDLFLHDFAKPGERHPKRGEPIRARSTNTLDEVPDNRAWFTNRAGSRPLSLDEIARGPGGSNGPPAPGKWTVTAAKNEGVTPGFRIRDARGDRYVVKFDPKTNPEMATAADVIGAHAFHALGYNVPENYIVEFDPEDLEIGENAKMPDPRTGIDRPIGRFDVDHALLRVPRLPDGRIRAVASRFLKGKILGEFRYFGTRADDPNDTVPHEHRRELRGLFVFDAWLNHNDSRAINDLDSLVEEDGLKFVKHHLIDFGAILGSASVYANTARDGNAYLYDGRAALFQALTLGVFVPHWARAKYVKTPAVGTINWDAFRPDDWKPNYRNPAFENRLPDDEFWAAKKLMALSDAHIAALVRLGRYSNPRDEQLMTRYLTERRDRIGRTVFAEVLPLDGFRVEGGALAWDDLAARHGFAPAAEVRVAWSRYDNAASAHTPLQGAAGPALPPDALAAPLGAYFAAQLTAGEPGKATTVWLRKTGGGLQVVGVRRDWPSARQR